MCLGLEKDPLFKRGTNITSFGRRHSLFKNNIIICSRCYIWTVCVLIDTGAVWDGHYLWLSSGYCQWPREEWSFPLQGEGSKNRGAKKSFLINLCLWLQIDAVLPSRMCETQIIPAMRDHGRMWESPLDQVAYFDLKAWGKSHQVLIVMLLNWNRQVWGSPGSHSYRDGMFSRSATEHLSILKLWGSIYWVIIFLQLPQNNYGQNEFAPLEEQNSSQESLLPVSSPHPTLTHTETMTFTGD